VSGIGGGSVEEAVCRMLVEAGKRNADRGTNYVKNENAWLLWLLRYKFQA
jgi:hypothetical protein